MAAKKSTRTRKKRKSVAQVPRESDPGALLSVALDERWRIYRLQLLRTRRRPTERSVHDLRVATRRLIAALDLAQTLLPSRSLRRVRKRLKKTLKGFNRLRDVHVQLLTVRGLVRFHPVLRSFGSALAVEERRLVLQARKQTAQLNPAAMEELTAEFEALLVSALGHPAAAHAGRTVLIGAAGSAFTRAVELRHRLAPDTPATVHAFRVAFKKLRYTLEVLRPLLPWITDSILKSMNRYQTAMGEIQDSEVLLENLKEFARSRPAASFMPVFQEITRERTSKIEAFMRQADEIYGYWGESVGKYQDRKTAKNQIRSKDRKS